MRPARLGAVSYLNTTPLVRGLADRPDLFTVRFDVPSLCASLLHAGTVDVGLIPAVEYLRGEVNRIVPGHDTLVFDRHPSWKVGENEVGEVHVAAWDKSLRPA